MADIEKRLRAIYAELPEEQRKALLEFGEFLHHRYSQSSRPERTTPLGLPRPAEESVIAALKRLASNYPMLSRSALLDETAPLVMEHVQNGVAASEVIDQFETIFLRHYERFTAERP